MDGNEILMVENIIECKKVIICFKTGILAKK
jgi:hypothetical protein